MASPGAHVIHPEVPEFAVLVLDGSRHPALNAAADSGVIYRSSASSLLQGIENEPSNNYTQLYSACSTPANELLETANKYLKKREQPLLKLGDLNGWKDVENSMLLACDTIDDLSDKDRSTIGFTGKVKSAFRALCQRAEIGLTFTSMVPSEMPCSSVLCGGLKAVFTALQRSHNYREDVYKAIEDIPYILNDHALDISVGAQDGELHRRNAALYVALFRLMQHILVWFVKNPLVTGMKFLVSPQGFSDALKDKSADVTKAVARFEKHALILRNKRSDRMMNDLHYWMAYNAGRTRRDGDLVRDQCNVLEKMHQLLQPMHDRVMEEGAQRQRQLELSLHESVDGAQELRESLLLELAYEKRLRDHDCQEILSIRRGFGSRLDTDRITLVQTSSQLQAWISISDSSLLLVDGGSSTSSGPEISYVAARVVESALALSKQTSTSNHSNTKLSVMPLAFFCSQHRDRRHDTHARPRGLAKALLAQLIDQFTGLSLKELQAYQNNLEADNTESICRALRRVLKKLPDNCIVVLVLEGIDILMEDKTRVALRHIIQSLVRTHGGKHAAMLKFLFTCTTSARPIEDLFREWVILRVPRVSSSSGSYRSLLWKDSGSLGSLGGL
ncbi:hypothetical protein GGR53DRAFT_261497 [Hypoxylon sp. FL1150]|nr:hypothetical protein GGR53DRAFT_261497 [Hypoxylon sp. FL1150]